MEVKTNAASKCPSCGAEMIYLPESGQLFCEYCGALSGIEKSEASTERELDFNLEQTVGWSDSQTFRCANCGAETVFERTEIAKQCAFCGSSNIMGLDKIDGIKPDALIPFEINPETAREKYHAWVDKKFFAPRDFKNYVKNSNVLGVYIPAWSFDCYTYSNYTAVVGDYYYVTIRTKNGTTRVRKIRYRTVSGKHNLFFDDVMVEASPHLTQKDLQRIQPFDVARLTAYNKKFMAGFVAEHYDKGLNQSWADAREIIDRRIKSSIASSISCDVVQSVRVNTAYNDKKYRYLLLPVYVGGTKFKDKLYNFFLNGVNGKATGKTPISMIKAGLVAVLGGLLLIGALIFMQYIFGNTM